MIIHAPFPLIFKELVLLAVFTTSSLSSKTSNSLRSLCVCVKQLLAPLSSIILILSWFLCVLHFTQFDELEEHLLLQKNSTLLSRLLKLLSSCNFSSLVRVQTVKLVDTNLCIVAIVIVCMAIRVVILVIIPKAPYLSLFPFAQPARGSMARPSSGSRGK
jgi:hypothetical protein